MKIEGIKIENPEEFLQSFLSEYLKGGFGRMNKTDFELLLMYLFVHGNSFKGMSNFDISLLLKIPESKVRRLKYESELRYGDHEKADNNLITLLINCRAEYSNDYIVFSIEDKFTQMLFVSELKKQLNSFADYSFNPELVKVSKAVFSDFLGKKYGVEVSEAFEDEYVKKDEEESNYHYGIRAALEKKMPIRDLLTTVSKTLQTAAAFTTIWEFIKNSSIG